MLIHKTRQQSISRISLVDLIDVCIKHFLILFVLFKSNGRKHVKLKTIQKRKSHFVKKKKNLIYIEVLRCVNICMSRDNLQIFTYDRNTDGVIVIVTVGEIRESRVQFTVDSVPFLSS